MGAVFDLLNFSKRERVSCVNIGAGKAREFIWNAQAGAIVLWYLFRNRGDQIAFVSDYDCDAGREFFGERASHTLAESFADRTEETIVAAVEAGIIEDHGVSWRDPLDPDLVYTRDIRVRASGGPLPDEGLH